MSKLTESLVEDTTKNRPFTERMAKFNREQAVRRLEFLTTRPDGIFVEEHLIGPQLIGSLIKIQAFDRGEDESGESVLISESLQDYVGTLQSYVRSATEWLFFFEGGMNITFYKENQHIELHVIG